jgi:HD-GYP domain-containing protein (c-di-GMP phosphodiesterase class II)
VAGDRGGKPKFGPWSLHVRVLLSRKSTSPHQSAGARGHTHNCVSQRSLLWVDAKIQSDLMDSVWRGRCRTECRCRSFKAATANCLQRGTKGTSMRVQQTAALTGENTCIRFEQGVVKALLTVMERREPALAAHARRVADLAVQIGWDFYPDADMGTLRIAALLHDVGKVALPACIVRKAGPLSAEEQTAMRLHPEFGYEIARRAPVLVAAAHAILAHHEHFDGTGYPCGLESDDIPLEARIIAVADAFDVMTHQRPYKRASTALEAVVEIAECAGTQFDPGVAESLNRMMAGAGLSDALSA